MRRTSWSQAKWRMVHEALHHMTPERQLTTTRAVASPLPSSPRPFAPHRLDRNPPPALNDEILFGTRPLAYIPLSWPLPSLPSPKLSSVSQLSVPSPLPPSPPPCHSPPRWPPAVDQKKFSIKLNGGLSVRFRTTDEHGRISGEDGRGPRVASVAGCRGSSSFASTGGSSAIGILRG